MPLRFTPLLRLKRVCVCDQWHSSWVVALSVTGCHGSHGSHCTFGSHTEGEPSITRVPVFNHGAGMHSAAGGGGSGAAAAMHLIASGRGASAPYISWSQSLDGGVRTSCLV
jgi:hypothetical protein